MAVVATDVNSMGGDQSPCRRHSVKLFDHRTHNIDKLRHVVALYDWSHVKCATDITVMYDRFLAALSQLLYHNIPTNVVKMGIRDPPFITPLIKHLLRKRNKLRRKGKYLKPTHLLLE